MTYTYALDVRDEQPPHAVMGQLPVPYEAAIGRMVCVNLAERTSWSGSFQARTIHTRAIHAFVEHDYRILAFKMSRERWNELKGKLG